jgi:hypothetical protein
MNGTHDESNPAVPATPAVAPAARPTEPVATYAPAPQPTAGAAPAPARKPERKSPVLACILSAMPGLGQVYVGYYQRGFTHAIVVATIIFVLNLGVRGIEPLLGIFLAFFWLYNIIDAGLRASHYNRAAAGAQAFEMPKDFAMPGMRGSIFGGLLLIGAGAIFLSHTLFGISLAWIESWWPLAPILFGVYLIGKGIVDRASKDAEAADSAR